MAQAVSPNDAPGFVRKERERIYVLWRRLWFLRDRITQNNGGSHDIAEHNAIEWVMREAGLPLPPKK